MATPAHRPRRSDLYRELEADPAPTVARLLASAIDVALAALVAAAAFLGVGLRGLGPAEGAAGLPDPWDAAGAGVVLALALALWLWNRVVRVAWRGGSVGMRWVGIRLVSVRTGAAPTLDEALVHELLGLLLLPLGCGLVPALLDGERRAPHDRAAGVAVIAPRP